MSEDMTLDEFSDSTTEENQGQKRENETKEVRLGPRKVTIPGSWSITELNEVGKIVTGDTPSTENDDYFGDEYPFVTPEDLRGNEEVDYIRRGLSEKGLKEIRSIPAGSVMMDCIGSDMGKVALAKRELATNQQINSVVPDENMVNSIFLKYQLQIISDIIRAQAGSTATPILNKGRFSASQILLSPLPEQRKIATVLYTVDRAIEKNEQIREKANEAEEASKAEFFTRGYSECEVEESAGWRCRANRFPKDWEVKPAEEMMKITRGASPRPRSDDSLFGGEIPWIKIGDAERGVSKRIEQVDSYVTEKGKKKSKFVEEGTLLVANSGATCGFSVFAGVDGCVHDGWLILREYDGLVPDFLYHYINWNYDYLQSLSLGSAQTNLSTGLFGRLDIPIPPIQEQQQIVEALDSINQITSHTSKEVSQLKRLKRGLIQDLLSGTVRTTDTNIEVPEEITQYG